jgi:hypothetical protein
MISANSRCTLGFDILLSPYWYDFSEKRGVPSGRQSIMTSSQFWFIPLQTILSPRMIKIFDIRKYWE